MTARGMMDAVGATANIRFESLEVTCKVLDVKNAWGRIRLLVRPVCGTGEMWVELTRVGRECESAVKAAVTR